MRNPVRGRSSLQTVSSVVHSSVQKVKVQPVTPSDVSKPTAAFPPHETHLFFFFFHIIRHSWRFPFFPSSAVVSFNMYVHHWLPWLVLIRCCRGDSVSGIQTWAGWCCGPGWRSLLGEFWRLFLGFQSVYERLDAALHAGGHPPGHGVCGGRGGGASALGGRPSHQTLLVPQLKKKMRWLVEFITGNENPKIKWSHMKWLDKELFLQIPGGFTQPSTSMHIIHIYKIKKYLFSILHNRIWRCSW